MKLDIRVSDKVRTKVEELACGLKYLYNVLNYCNNKVNQTALQR